MGCDELVDPCFGKPFPAGLAGLSCEHKRSAGWSSKICPSKSPEEKHQTSPNVLLWKTNSTLILFSGPDGDQDVQTRNWRFGETLPLEPKLTPTERSPWQEPSIKWQLSLGTLAAVMLLEDQWTEKLNSRWKVSIQGRQSPAVEK